MKPIRTLSLLLILATTASAFQSTDGASRGATAPTAGTGPGVRVARDGKAAPAPAAASGMTLKEVREAFTKADADRSSGLSADEAAFAGVDAASFGTADADGDGRLSQDEYVVTSESRVAKLSGGAAADLTAESTRIQALRRAQQAEAQRSRRGGASQEGGAAGQTGATPAPGPAAARRALPETPATESSGGAPKPAAAGEAAPPTLQELRASIVRRLRNGEISEEEARKQIEAVDRRIAGGDPSTAPAAGEVPAAGAAAAETKVDLRSIEATLNRRIRNSDLPPEKAAELYGDTLRRIENARGASPAGAPPAPARVPLADAKAGDSAAAGETPAEPKAQGFRAKIAEAQSNLTRRVRNAELTPEEAEKLRAAQAERIRHAVGSLGEGGTTQPPANGAAPVAEPARPARSARPASDAAAATPSAPAAPATAQVSTPAPLPTRGAAAPAETSRPDAGPARTGRPPADPQPAAPAQPARPARTEPQAPPATGAAGASPAPAAKPAPAGGAEPAKPAPARPARPASGGN